MRRDQSTSQATPTPAGQTSEPRLRDRFSTYSRALALLCALALAAGVFLLYWPAAGFEYVGLDDIQYVGTNRAVNRGLTLEGLGRAFTDTRVGYWTPLLWISYMLDVEIYGPTPAGFHFTNVLLQAIVSALLVLVLFEMTGALWPSLLAAALFSFHPLRVEAVAWIASRKDLLSMLFFLPSILFYARYARSGHRRDYAFTMALFVLGMTAKPVLLTFPFLLLILDLWPLGRTRLWDAPPRLAAPKKTWKALVLEKIPVLAVSAAFAVSAVLLQGEGLYRIGGKLSVWARLKMAVTSYMVHLKNTFWPVDLPLLEFFLPSRVPVVWAAIPSFFAGCILTWLAVRQVRTRPYMTVGWLWFAVSLIPVCGLAPAGMQWIADRFTYVPHLMFLTGLAWWAVESAGRRKWARRALVPVAVSVLAVLAALSHGRSGFWKDGVALFSRAVEKDPQNYLSRLQLGIALAPAGRLPEAEEAFRTVIEQNPFFVRGHFFLGMTYLDMGRYQEAATKFTEVLANDEKFHPAHYMLGKALTKLGDYAPAERHLREYLQLEPESDLEASTLTLLGVVKASGGEMDDALGFLGDALDSEPLFPQAHYNLALALWAQGRRDDAEPHFVTALTGSLKLQKANLQLIEDVENEGRVDEAAVHIKRYLKLFPDDPKAAELLERLGILALKSGDSEGATPWFRQALEKEPENLLFQLNLAENLFRTGQYMEASSYFVGVAARSPGSAEGGYAQGRTLQVAGRVSEATSVFRLALASTPILPGTIPALERAISELLAPGGTAPRTAPGSVKTP